MSEPRFEVQESSGVTKDLLLVDTRGVLKLPVYVNYKTADRLLEILNDPVREAAPELYDALFTLFEHAKLHSTDLRNTNHNINEMVTKALAKARGEK